MTLNDFRNTLLGATLDDVLLAGFIDREDTPARFRALRCTVYFQFGPRVVEFEAIER